MDLLIINYKKMKEVEGFVKKPKIYVYPFPGGIGCRGQLCEWYDEKGNRIVPIYNPYGSLEWSEVVVLEERPVVKKNN